METAVPERDMLEDQVSPSQEAERAELDAVVEALSRSPRLSRLLRYLGDKYFQGQIDQLHEYNIATEVFGRSKTAFDAGEDAIARVEAHRLRKKLKEFYETEGKNRPIQVSIPSGTYVPVFTRRTDDAESTPTVEPLRSIEQSGDFSELFQPRPPTQRPTTASVALPPSPSRWLWVYVLLAVTVAIGAAGTYLATHPGAIAKLGNSGATPPATANAPASSPQVVAAGAPTLPIRILAGYSGKPQIDSAGAIWGTDRYFHEGGTWSRPANFIARTSDPLLFEQWRTGDFFYDIPLQPGAYELHLYFVTSDRAGDTTSTFSIGINGTKVLAGFDVNSDALGENIADERIFRDVSPAKDGYLHLAFTSERGAPALNALEILPGIAHKQLPIRIVTQPTSFTDHDGNVWHSDTYYMSGRLSSQRQQIAGSPDPQLFGAERYGHFTYAIPVDTRDRYTLVLHFAELYFGPHASGVGGTGSRLFRVMCNGVAVLDDFDIYKEAGSLHALTKTFYHVKPTAQGKINLTFEPVVNNATVSGIEVLDESQ
jgi:Malectin domain